MNEKIKVKAKKGLLVPFESSNYEFIDDSKFIEVANTVYYRRRISDGDLERKADKKGENNGE